MKSLNDAALSSRKRRQPSPITLADRARDAGEWEEAARLYREVLERNPKNAPIWVQYGHVLKESGRLPLAEAAYRRALEGEDAGADTHLQLGHVLKLQGRSEAAGAAYLRALALDPDCGDARRELAALGWDEARLSAVEATLGAGAGDGASQRGRPTRITLADRARDAGQWELAARLYREALERNPRNAPIWVQYGHVLKESGKLAQAEIAYRRAIADDPGAAELYLHLGHVLKLQGKTDVAEAAYLRSLLLDPSRDDSISDLRDFGWADAQLLMLGEMRGADQHSRLISRIDDEAPRRSSIEADVLHQPVHLDPPRSGTKNIEDKHLCSGAAPPATRKAVTLWPGVIGEAPTVSVIMPTYNRGATMERSVKLYSECASRVGGEVIVIDDGSKDDTPERLRQLARLYPNIVTDRIENSGPARARNLAASMARGSILVFVGDDVMPLSDDFLEIHLLAHQRFSRTNQAILGKISWPNANELPVNFVMAFIQGDGEQQFGYKNMQAYAEYDWRLFYSSNVSIKSSLVDDWVTDGFNTSFNEAAYEDAEFALRLTKKFQALGEDFRILYVPAAGTVHFHPYTTTSFLRRQVSAGMMAGRFLELHPEREIDLGLGELISRLNSNSDQPELPIEHYFAIFEGLKSWLIVIENHYGLGAQNWHADALRAIFQVAYFEGYLRTRTDPRLSYANACRYVLETVRGNLHRSIFSELIGDKPGFGFV